MGCLPRLWAPPQVTNFQPLLPREAQGLGDDFGSVYLRSYLGPFFAFYAWNTLFTRRSRGAWGAPLAKRTHVPYLSLETSKGHLEQPGGGAYVRPLAPWVPWVIQNGERLVGSILT